MKKTLLVIFAAAIVLAGCKQKTVSAQAQEHVQNGREATVAHSR